MEDAKPRPRTHASSVLVVDDEGESRQELALLLTSAGFDVKQAAGAQEAEERLAAKDIGIVLVDGDMPNISGFELCRRIRKALGTAVYVILRTTKGQLFERELNIDEGADDFLITPHSDRETLARVETGRKMKQLQETLEETSRSLAVLDMTDPLTGAFNKKKTDSEIKREMERSRRYGRPLSLVMLNIDGFRGLNDKLGRAAGDRVLEEVGRILRLCVRATDILGRYGGEEFAVVLPETRKDQALGAAEKMRKIIAQTAIAVGGRSVHVTVSGGIAVFEDGNFEAQDDFVAAARDALAKAKAAGRNRCEAS